MQAEKRLRRHKSSRWYSAAGSGAAPVDFPGGAIWVQPCDGMAARPLSSRMPLLVHPLSPPRWSVL
jgi:hypothetical protein